MSTHSVNPLASNLQTYDREETFSCATRARQELRVFATSPQSINWLPASYLAQVAAVAQWSEDAGCTGTLIYTDNSVVDPWLVAQTVLAHTRTLSPLVAVQPVYMHPYAVAKMVTSLAFLHGRRIYLNMVAGGFKNDLLALNDQTPHDRRYDRLVEYTKIIRLLLESRSPVTFEGEFYRIEKLQLKPELPAELMPEIFISGSSPAGVQAAEEIGATAIRYPEPPDRHTPGIAPGASAGVRVGIIARATREEAWRIASERFPQDRKGQIAHGMAMRVSDSQWHQRLSELSALESSDGSVYWLGPFEYSKSNCPYLVGTYGEVAGHLGHYVKSGIQTFILDIPPSQEDLQHVEQVFRLATLSQPAAAL